MKNRRRFRQTRSLEERLADEAKRLREAAKTLPQGIERDRLLRKARLDETALQMTAWLKSPGLKPPL